jgi:hypothetical protein
LIESMGDKGKKGGEGETKDNKTEEKNEEGN